MRGFLLIVILGLTGACVPEASNSRSKSKSLNSVSSDSDETEIAHSENGVSYISGAVKAADGVTPLVGAKISMVKKNGQKVGLTEGRNNSNKTGSSDECVTDSKGRFKCKTPKDENGRKKFEIEVPDVAKKEFEAEIEEESVTTVDEKITRVSGDEVVSKWLVVPGQYDGVQLLLSQMKGCTLSGNEKFSWLLRKSADCSNAGLDVLDDAEVESFFSNEANLASYKFIFINCPRDISKHFSSLQKFVTKGGHIYFSDWSALGLEKIFPGNIKFGERDTDYGIAQGKVNDSSLVEFLGSGSFDVRFDLSDWVPIKSIGQNVTPFISSDTTELGGQENAPITVGWQNQKAGCVFFTSYHIEGASTGARQEQSLKFLLLNLDRVCRT